MVHSGIAMSDIQLLAAVVIVGLLALVIQSWSHKRLHLPWKTHGSIPTRWRYGITPPAPQAWSREQFGLTGGVAADWEPQGAGTSAYVASSHASELRRTLPDPENIGAFISSALQRLHAAKMAGNRALCRGVLTGAAWSHLDYSAPNPKAAGEAMYSAWLISCSGDSAVVRVESSSGVALEVSALRVPGDAVDQQQCPVCHAVVSGAHPMPCEYCNEPLPPCAGAWAVDSIDVVVRGVYRGNDGGVGQQIREKSTEGMEGTLESIRASDPEFDPEALVGDVVFAFDALLRSLQQGAGVGPVLPDEVGKREEHSLREVFAGHDTLEYTLGNAAVSFAHADQDIQRITVSVDWRVPGVKRLMTESWTLVRQTGATTHLDRVLLRGTCPQCGSPLVLEADARCHYCHVHVFTTSLGWVVEAIRRFSG